MQQAHGTEPVPNPGSSGFWVRLVRRIAVPRPRWLSVELIALLGTVCMLAFGITGFTGYDNQPGWLTFILFTKPVALFGFGCLVLFVLQRLIMRHPTGKDQPAKPNENLVGNQKQAADELLVTPIQAAWAYTATVVSIAIVTVIDIAPDLVAQILNAIGQVLHQASIMQVLVDIANTYFLVVVTVDFLLRWVISLRSLIAGWRDEALRERRLGSLFRLVANDAIAGAFLVALLAAFFQRFFFAGFYETVVNVVQRLISLGTPPPITDCTLSYAFYDCSHLPAGFSPNDLPTITFFDSIFALVLLAAGMFFLTIDLLVRALRSRQPMITLILNAVKNLRRVNHVLALAVESIITPLRRVLWPACVFLAVVFVGIAVKVTQAYLHLLNCQHQMLLYGQYIQPVSAQPNPGDCVSAVIDPVAQNYREIGWALGATALALLLIVIAAVLQLYVRENPAKSGRLVAGYWLPAIVWIVGRVAVPFGALTLTLLVVNVIFWLVIFGSPLPFFPPGVLTYVTTSIFIIMLIVGFARPRRQ